jgi:hypothetical protein
LAKILAKHVTQGRLAQERGLLPSVLGMYGIKVDDLKLPDSSALWNVFVTRIFPKRNAIIHDEDNAAPDEAKLALDCANTLRGKVVVQIAKKMGFDLEKNGAWHKHLNAEGFLPPAHLAVLVGYGTHDHRCRNFTEGTPRTLSIVISTAFLPFIF